MEFRHPSLRQDVFLSLLEVIYSQCSYSPYFDEWNTSDIDPEEFYRFREGDLLLFIAMVMETQFRSFCFAFFCLISNTFVYYNVYISIFKLYRVIFIA